MEFKAAKCPACGGSLQLPVDRTSVNCMYCGGTIVVREAIHAAAFAKLPSLLKLARTALQSGNYKEAHDYFTRVLEADSDNWEAWSGKAEASGLLLGPKDVRLQEVVTCFGNALQTVPFESREALEHKVATFVNKIVGQYYSLMRKELSPGFGQAFYWNAYLEQLRRVITTLEQTHILVPNNPLIVKAILSVCRENHCRVSYVNLGGQIIWRPLSEDTKAYVSDVMNKYLNKLQALDPVSDESFVLVDPPRGLMRVWEAFRNYVVGAK